MEARPFPEPNSHAASFCGVMTICQTAGDAPAPSEPSVSHWAVTPAEDTPRRGVRRDRLNRKSQHRQPAPEHRADGGFAKPPADANWDAEARSIGGARGRFGSASVAERLGVTTRHALAGAW